MGRTRKDKAAELSGLTQEQQEAALREAEIQAQILAAQRIVKIQEARQNLIPFMQMMKPDQFDPEDADKTGYEVAMVHVLVAELLEKVERGELTRLAISMPPRIGKSEEISRMFPAWAMGRDPYRQIPIVGYSAEFAEAEFGSKIRRIVQSPQYRQVFPMASLAGGSKAVGNLVFTEGGNVASVGKCGPLTGRGADIAIVDDPLKDYAEANSAKIRESLWEWFNSVLMTRLMPGASVIIVHTRWHEDDLIGRLCDPTHPDHNPEVAKDWMYINLPAIIKDKRLADALKLEMKPPTDEKSISVFGNQPCSLLWPGRYPMSSYAEIKRRSPKTYSALYDGKPSPDEGDFFKRDMIKTYLPHELPKNLRYYAASDHAVSTQQERDATCMGAVGVDEQDHIWVLPDLWWYRKQTDDVVDAMLHLMNVYAPLYWWAEKGHISKSIGPFLRKRMMEEKCYINLVEMTPSKDKETRAQSIQGRMSMGMVHFPSFAPWWSAANEELLKFPNATHDDFVDFIAWIGIGLSTHIRAEQQRAPERKYPRTGTIEWVKFSSRHQEQMAKQKQEAWN